jgi:hypothetical protein
VKLEGVTSCGGIGRGEAPFYRGEEAGSQPVGGDRRWPMRVASIASITKSKWRGRGDARALIDEGKGGGTGGASVQL